jgi:hypothetical protein
MGCLIIVLAWLSPRLVIALLWLATERMTIAFNSGVVAVAGFVLAPSTTVLYALAYRPAVGVSGVGWLVVAVGVLVDLSSYTGSGGYAARRR